MNITPSIRTITEYHFTLSDEDLERYKADPWSFRDDVLEQLSLPKLKTDGGNGKVKPARRKAAARQSGRKNGKVARAKPTRPGKATALSCPHCPKTFSYPGYLRQHLRKAHPDIAGGAE